MSWFHLIAVAGLSLATMLGCSDTTPPDGDGGSGGSAGQDKECSATTPCPNGGVCLFGENACAPGAKGQCETVFSCDGPAQGPVCQCDGEVLEGEMAVCALIAKGQPSAEAEVCAKGTFTCGTLSCKRNVEVCVVKSGGAMGSMPSYTCTATKDIGGTCSSGIADCSCLDPSSLGCAGGSCCVADADHQETITIQAP